VWSLIELKNGELISGGLDGSLRRWGDSMAMIEGACRQLREHPALLNPQTPAETAASAKCSSWTDAPLRPTAWVEKIKQQWGDIRNALTP
jgi:hypothetical protein